MINTPNPNLIIKALYISQELGPKAAGGFAHPTTPDSIGQGMEGAIAKVINTPGQRERERERRSQNQTGHKSTPIFCLRLCDLRPKNLSGLIRCMPCLVEFEVRNSAAACYHCCKLWF